MQGMETEMALRDSETRFRSVAESATDAIVAADQNGDMISWNRGAERIFGYTEGEVLGKPLSMLMPEQFRPMHDAGIQRVVDGGVAASKLIGIDRRGRRPAQGRARVPARAVAGHLGHAERPLLLRDHPRHLRAQEGRGQDPAPCSRPRRTRSSRSTRDARIVLANARTDQLFGYDREEIIKRPIEKLFAERSRELVAERFNAALDRRATPIAFAIGRRPLGPAQGRHRVPGRRHARARSTTDDGVVVTSIIRDVTERKRFETQLKHLADNDALTELYNRRRFEEELVEYGDYAARYSEGGAVLLLDLDRFKYVNDTHGHKAGDEVIRAVGGALRDERPQERRRRAPRRRRVRRAAEERGPRRGRARRRRDAGDRPRAASCRSPASASR